MDETSDDREIARVGKIAREAALRISRGQFVSCKGKSDEEIMQLLTGIEREEFDFQQPSK